MANKKKNAAVSDVEVLKPGQPGYEEQQAANAARQSAALQLFTPNTALAVVDASKFKRRNMAQLIKPGDVPVDSAITGTILAVVNSPTTAIKGKLFHIKNAKGVEFTFPVTGSIRQAIAPGIGDDDKELVPALEKEIGSTIVIKRCPSKISGKFKKEMFIFDVLTTKEYVDGVSAPK